MRGRVAGDLAAALIEKGVDTALEIRISAVDGFYTVDHLPF